jgi:hypothetical protein
MPSLTESETHAVAAEPAVEQERVNVLTPAAATALVVAAYGALGIALLWSRLVDLGHSFWTDEILMVDTYVRAGPHEILFGPGLSHELMALLSWVVTQVAGESEIALRLLSAVPFIAGVALVTTWLHRRLGALSGILFLFLATVSPLLLDITRQARGYGLAFFGMSVVVVAALEARRTGRAEAIVAMCAGGVLATWTLPQASFAFLATGAVLMLDRRTRLSAAIGLAASIVAIAAWYAPHSGAVESAAQIPDGVQIGFPWVLTAPVDQVVLPALIWIDGTALVAGVIWLPLVVLSVIVAAASPLLRDWRSALILCAGAFVTGAALWIEQAYVIPRYLSFLLAPLFIVLATGAAALLARLPRQPALARSALCLVAVVALGARFVALAPDVVTLPREANRDAAAAIERGPPGTPVLVYMRNPSNLEFYLDVPVERLRAATVARRVCGERRAVFYVRQPFTNADVRVPCLTRSGVQHDVFRQYARGDRMDVWYVPPGP